MEHSAEDGSLQFSNVKETYDQKSLAVKSFNLDVKQAGFVTLPGPCGSGKTTVLMMQAGFQNVSSGSAASDDHPITKTPPCKRNIGMVFEKYALFSYMTQAESQAYPLEALPRYYAHP